MDGATGLHFDFAEIIFSLILALSLAWTVGIWLGERLAILTHREERPRRTVGGLMTLVLVVALVLTLLAGDPRVILYAIVLIPPIAVLQYSSRSR